MKYFTRTFDNIKLWNVLGAFPITQSVSSLFAKQLLEFNTYLALQ